MFFFGLILSIIVNKLLIAMFFCFFMEFYGLFSASALLIDVNIINKVYSFYSGCLFLFS